MMRLMGAVCILASCSVYGFLKGQLWTERLELLRTIRKIFLTLSGDIRFGQISLPESLEQISKQVEMPFSRFLKNVCGEMRRCGGKTLADIFKQEADATLAKTALKPQDLESLKHMSVYLGNLDRETQLGMIQMYLAELDTTIKEITDSIHGRQKLCRMFGVAVGALVVILLL